MNSNFKFSIRKQMVLLTMLPLLVIIVSMEGFFLHERYISLDAELLKRGRLILHQLAISSEYGVFSGNRYFLHELAGSVLNEADVDRVVIADNASRILVSARKNASGKVDMGAPVEIPMKMQNNSVFARGKVWLFEPILSTQIALGDTESRPKTQKFGEVVIEMSEQRTRREESRLLLYTIMPTSLFSIAIMFLVFVASRRITEPIRRMSETVHALGAGELSARISEPSHITELQTLSAGINQMAEDLQHERNLLQQRINEATEQLRLMAFYDTLTRLPNRRLLNDRLSQAFAACKRNSHYGALMFLDLDDFKELNDCYGHAMGDLLLIEAGHRIIGCLRGMDTVARFGGDEFVVMLSELSTDYEESAGQANHVAEKIRAKLGEPYLLVHQPEGGVETKIVYQCTSSIGFVLFSKRSISEEEAMSRADAAMYEAKQGGGNQIRFHGDAE